MIKSLTLLLLPLVSLCQVNNSYVESHKNKKPLIALVNDVLYKNGDRHQDTSVTYVGTGFLLDTGHDTLAVTVKHVLYAARNNKTDKVVVNRDLQTWKLYPKNNPEDSVIIGTLINEDSTENLFSGDNGVLQRDWLVFTTTSISPNITPVRLRESKVDVGDIYHLESPSKNSR